MASYAAFLRGVNLGSNRRVSGDELRAIFTRLGFRDVDAFRTSGNVVFDADRRAPVAKTRARIEAALPDTLGHEVMVFLRSARELDAIAEGWTPARGLAARLLWTGLFGGAGETEDP